MPTYRKNTIDGALNALDGMAQIVNNDMLVRGAYVSDDFDPKMSDSICGGHKYCALGALWVGAGISPEKTQWGGFAMPCLDDDYQYLEDFVRYRHPLRVAYEALNTAASDFADKHGLHFSEYVWDSALEGVFESNSSQFGRPEILEVIESAREIIKSYKIRSEPIAA